MDKIVLQTNIAGQKLNRGKVRDIYELADKLLIVATDRISAFDVVMANGIPYKGVVLTQISRFWFDFLGTEVEHHLISDDVDSFPKPFANMLSSWQVGVCWLKSAKPCRLSAWCVGIWQGPAGWNIKQTARFAGRSCQQD